MALKKILDEKYIEEFKADWDLMTVGDLAVKYRVSKATIDLWSKDYNCTKPKKVIYSESHPLVVLERVTPKTVMEQLAQPDMNKVGIQHIEELRVCNDEFMKVVNDKTMPKREKDALLFNIAEKAMSVYISQQPTSKQYIECMAEFYKLKLYEKRVMSADKEKTEIDSATLKNLKKKHIQEAFDAIHAELSIGEQRLHEYLVQLATERILARKKKENEMMQQRAKEASGQISPDTVDDVVGE